MEKACQPIQLCPCGYDGHTVGQEMNWEKGNEATCHGIRPSWKRVGVEGG